jgi:hypothetical protein
MIQFLLVFRLLEEDGSISYFIKEYSNGKRKNYSIISPEQDCYDIMFSGLLPMEMINNG